jgi:hypothetical protein
MQNLSYKIYSVVKRFNVEKPIFVLTVPDPDETCAAGSRR